MKIHELPGLGPASEKLLKQAGIGTTELLIELGSVEAFRRVQRFDPRASMNLLWALEGALSNRDWREVARVDRGRLLIELDSVADGGKTGH